MKVQPYLSTHKSLIKEKYPRMSDKYLLKEHTNNLISWFNERISNDDSASDTIKWMSYMPKFNLVTWTAYDITIFFLLFIQNQKIIVVQIKIVGLCLMPNTCISQVRKIRILYWHIERTLGSLRRFVRFICFIQSDFI